MNRLRDRRQINKMRRMLKFNRTVNIEYYSDRVALSND